MTSDAERLVAGTKSGNTAWDAFRLGIRSSLSHPLMASQFFVATVLQGLLQGVLVYVLRDVLRKFGGQHNVTTSALTVAALIILGIWVLRSVSTFVGEVVSARLAHTVEVSAMQQVIAKLLSLSVRFFDKNSQGDLVMASYFDLKGVRMVTLDVGNVVLFSSRLIGLAVVAWMMSPKLAVIGLLAVPIGALPAHWFGRQITEAAKLERDAVRSLYESFLEVSSGIRVIKVGRAEPRVLDKAHHIAHELFRHVLRQAFSKGFARFLMEAVSGVGLVLVLTIGSRDVGQGTLDWQSLLSLLVAVMAVYTPVLGLLQVYSTMRSILPNLDRVDRIVHATPDIADRPNAKALTGAPKVIAFDHVSFAYDGQQVLHDVTATFHRGETIGIVGPSGAGKSTLLSLLLRFYDPTGGRVLFDGVDLRDIKHADLMGQCAIVLQEPFLFIDTVVNNIRWANPSATMDDVVAAAKAANIHDDIMGLEEGYETVLGRRKDARGVSVGQKQRICIAASLLKNAPILFLDEATSNLDSVSERSVQGAIERLMEGRTTFVVAHRLTTLRNVDRIMVMEQGRLVALAPHEELIVTSPTYQRLWQYQNSSDADLAEQIAERVEA
jgi:subfamily B ATP-binding cassette protein MsbA